MTCLVHTVCVLSSPIALFPLDPLAFGLLDLPQHDLSLLGHRQVKLRQHQHAHDGGHLQAREFVMAELLETLVGVPRNAYDDGSAGNGHRPRLIRNEQW